MLLHDRSPITVFTQQGSGAEDGVAAAGIIVANAGNFFISANKVGTLLIVFDEDGSSADDPTAVILIPNVGVADGVGLSAATAGNALSQGKTLNNDARLNVSLFHFFRLLT